MDTTELTAAQLRERLAARGIPRSRFAAEAGLQPGDFYQILAGIRRIGPARRTRIETAIARLGLDREALVAPKSEPKPEPEPPTFRITQF